MYLTMAIWMWKSEGPSCGIVSSGARAGASVPQSPSWRPAGPGRRPTGEWSPIRAIFVCEHDRLRRNVPTPGWMGHYLPLFQCENSSLPIAPGCRQGRWKVTRWQSVCGDRLKCSLALGNGRAPGTVTWCLLSCLSSSVLRLCVFCPLYLDGRTKHWNPNWSFF